MALLIVLFAKLRKGLLCTTIQWAVDNFIHLYSSCFDIQEIGKNKVS